MKRLLYLATLSMVATLLFAPAALAQASPGGPTDTTGNCIAGQAYIPEFNGCIAGEGSPDLLINQLNSRVFDADTGEDLGLVKDLDTNLAANVPYEDFCAAFPTFEGETAQEYYDGRANAQEQDILDSDGDGIACNAGDTGAQPDQYETPDTPETPATPTATETPPATPETSPETGTDTVLPDTGGPGGAAVLLPAAGLLLASGLIGLKVLHRRP